MKYVRAVPATPLSASDVDPEITQVNAATTTSTNAATPSAPGNPVLLREVPGRSGIPLDRTSPAAFAMPDSSPGDAPSGGTARERAEAGAEVSGQCGGEARRAEGSAARLGEQ